jgi:MFS family permease
VPRTVLLGLAGAGLFIAALDAYVVVTLLPAMIADVGLTIDRFEQATPIVTGFLGGYVAAMPLLGAYSDTRGRAPVYAACMAAFAAGSAITATSGLWSAGGLQWMIAGRVLQGLGGGGLVPLSLALAADLYQGSSRTLALGWVAGLQEAGSVFGPLYGASLAALAASAGGWRFVFWLDVPLAAFCAAGLVVATRRSTVIPSSRTPSSIDWISAALLGLGLALLVVALYPDDPDHRATSAYLLPAGLASAIVLVLYGWRQVRRLEPLVPRDLLRSRSFIGAAVSNLLIGAALMVALVDVPVLGRLVLNLSQLDSGLLLSRFLAGVPVGAVLGGWLAGKLGGRLIAVGGIALSAAAFLQMSTWPANELSLHVGPLRQADVALFICGLGFGAVIAPLTAAVLALTRDQSHGLATSLVVLARTMGMLVGLSALTAFGLHRFHQILGTPVLSGDLKARVDQLAKLVAAAFLQEYREIFTVAAAMCGLAALVMLVTIGQRLRATAIK